MRECGLTHGGFYNQFESKEALAAEACATSLARGAAKWRRLSAEDGPDAITADYLSARNRDAPETGCALIALGPDAARKGGPLAAAFREGFEDLTAALQNAGIADRDAALARMAQLVGTMVLARAVDDPALSEELLAANRRALGVEA
jgi:TetR/AcrR family transcriptional repressor of nem operon